MINLPKTLCKDTICQKTSDKAVVYQIVQVDGCEEKRCGTKEPVVLKPIKDILCLCPVTGVVINSYRPVTGVVINSYRPKPIRTVTSKTCFVDFIKNMVKTKFCDVGPTCQAS